MRNLLPEWIWPRLDPETRQEIVTHTLKSQEMYEEIEQINWEAQNQIALEEARRLFDAEQERRRGADTKAGIYLAAVTALIPVLASVLPNLWKDDMNKVFACSSITLFAIALIYLLRAGLWAFRTIKVSKFVQLGPTNLIEGWKTNNPEQYLVRTLLKAVAYNYDGTNMKVTYIMMTHQFLIRSFLFFVVFLAFQSLWPIGAWTVTQINGLSPSPIKLRWL